MNQPPIRIGFVGCGRQASTAWYPNFATISDLDLVACCDLQPELAERNARMFGARHWYTDLGEMLAKEALDAVMVVGPPTMHYECGRQVLDAGLPLMMEKPAALRSEQAGELADLAEAKGLITQIGHNMRHAPGVRKFGELMATPAFGKLLYLESRYFMPSPMWHDTSGVRPGWTYMIFQSVHAVDLARHLAGEIVTVYATRTVGQEGRFALLCSVTFANGATGAITLTGATPNWTCQLEAAGDARAHLRLINLHTLQFEPHTAESGYHPNPGIPGYYWNPATRDNAEIRSGYWGQMQAFAHAVRSGQPNQPSLRDAHRAMVVCDAMLDSIDQRLPIDLPVAERRAQKSAWMPDYGFSSAHPAPLGAIMSQLRVAVIGLGPIGNIHATMYTEDALANLAAVCDWDRGRADAAAAKYGVPAFYDVQQMLETVQPQVVSVATGGKDYGSEHYLPTIQALDFGCHVLGEKPISNEVEEAEEMVAKAEASGHCYGVNLNHRFTPAARLAKKWVDEDRIGHQLFCNMSMWIKNPRESSPWFHLKALHPHTIDVMRYFCGDVAAVHCFALQAPGRQIWSTATFNFRFKSGAVGTLTGSYDIERGHPMERCEVAGVKGRFVIDDMYREVTLYPAGNSEKTVYTNPLFGGYRDFNDTFRDRIHTFLAQVSAGVAPDRIDGKAADALAAQKVIAAAIESVETEAVVYVK